MICAGYACVRDAQPHETLCTRHLTEDDTPLLAHRKHLPKHVHVSATTISRWISSGQLAKAGDYSPPRGNVQILYSVDEARDLARVSGRRLKYDQVPE